MVDNLTTESYDISPHRCSSVAIVISPVQAKGPFARHEHDRGYEEELRSKSRFGDPFAHLAGSKASKPPAEVAALTELYNVEALEKSGDMLHVHAIPQRNCRFHVVVV